jgi:hypothetical protein
MIREILEANKFLLIVFALVLAYGAYSWWWDDDGTNQETSYTSNLGPQLNQSTENVSNQSNSLNESVDVRGVRDVGGGDGSTANQAVYETTPPILEGYVAGYGTQTSSGREYWVLLVATPQLDINGYEVDLRDMIGYRVVDTSRWQEGQFVRIYGTLESETVVRARAIQ